MTAAPDLTLTITPPGASPTVYTTAMGWSGTNQQMTITQNFGRQGDTSLIPLIDDYDTAPTFHIPVLSQIRLDDVTAGQNLFAGVVTDPTFAVVSPTQNEWDLDCTDFTFYADSAIVQGTYIGWTVDRIVVALTEQANCGISAATVADGGFVAPGPQLASFVQNYDTLSNAWRNLAQLAGQVTPYGWYVDENRALHFYDATTAQDSGVTFTTSPTSSGDGSLTEGHIQQDSQFAYEWDGTTIHNRILVQGATQTISYGSVTTNGPTDTWLGNGYQTGWPLRYTATGTPVLHINGVATTVDLVSAGSTGTATWQIVQNSVGTWSLTTTGSAPGSGVTIRLWYDYEVPVIAVASDYASQQAFTGPNRGVFAEFISDSSLTTVPMALARAMRERQEYAYPVERITFNTTPEWMGWARAGQTCRIVNQYVPDSQNGYQPGIDDTFLITANTITFGEGGYRQAQITAVRI